MAVLDQNTLDRACAEANENIRKAVNDFAKRIEQAAKLVDRGSQVQKDILVHLAEECSELVKVATKGYRFGFGTDAYEFSASKMSSLYHEIGDVLATLDILFDVSNWSGAWSTIEAHRSRKRIALKGLYAL